MNQQEQWPSSWTCISRLTVRPMTSGTRCTCSLAALPRAAEVAPSSREALASLVESVDALFIPASQEELNAWCSSYILALCQTREPRSKLQMGPFSLC